MSAPIEHGTHSRRSALIAGTILAILLLLAICSLYGIAYIAKGTNKSIENGDVLKYNALRGDCIRDVQASADQTFRVNIADLLGASVNRNDPNVLALIKKTKHDAHVNVARQVRRLCPPAIQGGGNGPTPNPKNARTTTKGTDR